MERKRSPESGPEVGPDGGDPAGKKRLLLCADFTSVASCDVAVARRYLAENAWEVERALNAYFEPRAEEDALPPRPAASPAPGSCVDLTQEEAPAPRGPPPQEDGSAFSLVTWNVDGLDLRNLGERAHAVCASIALYSPDVVFLQEVVPPYHSMLRKKASSYEIITGHDDGYFTAIMLKKSRVKLKSHEIIPFPSTQMMRNLLCVHASVSGNELCLMSSHLESTREHAEERARQLRMVLKTMQEAPESATVIFAGDTNLRDQEVTRCGGLPGSIADVWELLGRPPHCRYTWDTRLNSNLRIRAACRHRFDRIFLRAAAAGGRLVPRGLDLLGLDKLDCGRFPSDHWGLLCTMDVIL